MKVLSVVIPCYNSAEYMSHAVDTLLTGGEDIEIIIVDDGSAKDNTLEIAKEYEKKFPNIVKAIQDWLMPMECFLRWLLQTTGLIPGLLLRLWTYFVW